MYTVACLPLCVYVYMYVCMYVCFAFLLESWRIIPIADRIISLALSLDVSGGDGYGDDDGRDGHDGDDAWKHI